MCCSSQSESLQLGCSHLWNFIEIKIRTVLKTAISKTSHRLPWHLFYREYSLLYTGSLVVYPSIRVHAQHHLAQVPCPALKWFIHRREGWGRMRQPYTPVDQGFWFKFYWPAFTALDALKDCSKSAMMSSMCSVPTEIRIASSATPESRRSCLLSCWCVVDQGWMARVLESPTLLSQLDGFSIGG